MAAVTITVTVLSPEVRPVVSRTSVVAPSSSAIATTSTDVTPKATSKMHEFRQASPFTVIEPMLVLPDSGSALTTVTE